MVQRLPSAQTFGGRSKAPASRLQALAMEALPSS